MVSIVSGAEFRTTYLTGTVTDLGIGMAQCIRKNKNAKAGPGQKLRLCATTITCFFIRRTHRCLPVSFLQLPCVFLPGVTADLHLVLRYVQDTRETLCASAVQEPHSKVINVIY